MAENFVTKERLTLGTWQAFERLLARTLEHGGFTDVSVVGGTGDGGADIVGMKDSERWVIQAKFRSNGNVGREALEEAINAVQSYEAAVSVVVTNQEFSQDAKNYRELLSSQGYDCRLWNGSLLMEYSAHLFEYSHAKHSLRDYQEGAVNEVFRSYDQGKGKALITLATGLGKTVVLSQIIDEYLAENGDHQVLVLAHMSDLVRQLEQSCWRRFHRTVETHLWTDGEEPAYRSGVTFATWQSVESARRRGTLFKGDFELIVVDECHHAPSDSFRELLGHLSPKFLLGVTATPWRGDGMSLRPLFGDPVYSMTVIEGIQRGFLSEVEYEMLLDNIDWDEVQKLSRLGLSIKDLNQRLYVPERDLGMIEEVGKRLKEIKRPKALVFCRSIRHAERLQRHFRQIDVSAGIVHSKLSRQEKFTTLTNFRKGSLKVLISIDMLNEGIDIPEVNVVIFARVTHSRKLFLQQLGRGLRLSSGKDQVLVLDFVADVRRIAEAYSMNREAMELAAHEEVRYPEGEIVKFNQGAKSFFMEYLADISDLEDLDESAKLEFPA
ncbi:DEAD/DEAH box helicase family protein [Akkermansiaceae bacterium]|nr:DEAD/DEAH box helicase family protein [Akkermansiaceae bacterium]MDA8958548.1 DEAD/DEAH box helicase family protein [bacterium]MDA7616302.1 DEAD/DEAH box helicase family protein [Akkermansiaceae bacterium]MDB4426329.1 DEAD/DEAH box helicase family protein [bacterium]MDB4456962.1 DEAD/DEAH box helicase family protein [Akkermansiaceae bacterium]